jgi:hypothetical protein
MNRKKRLRLLLGFLLTLSVAHVIRGIDRSYWPAFLRADSAPARPLEPWMTEEFFREKLDGKPVYDHTEMDAAGNGIVTITLRKEEISSVKIRRLENDWTSEVEFELDHQGRRYHVTGSCDYYSHGQYCECGKHAVPSSGYHELSHFSLIVVSKR